MKLKYKHQRFQADAAKSVTDIFIGQQYCDSADFLIDQGKDKKVFDLIGFGNQKLMLDRESITENLRQVQMNWGLNLLNTCKVISQIRCSPLKWKPVPVRLIHTSKPCMN